MTILTIGPTLYPALDAARRACRRPTASAPKIDRRALARAVQLRAGVESVRKTGRLIVVTEASERGSFAMTLSANITRFAFGELKAPPRVLGSPNWIVPGADMEQTYFPQADDIVDIVCRRDVSGQGAQSAAACATGTISRWRGRVCRTGSLTPPARSASAPS